MNKRVFVLGLSLIGVSQVDHSGNCTSVFNSLTSVYCYVVVWTCKLGGAVYETRNVPWTLAYRGLIQRLKDRSDSNFHPQVSRRNTRSGSLSTTQKISKMSIPFLLFLSHVANIESSEELISEENLPCYKSTIGESSSVRGTKVIIVHGRPFVYVQALVPVVEPCSGKEVSWPLWLLQKKNWI